MNKKQKAGTPDLRGKLTTDMTSQVGKICKQEGFDPDRALIKRHVEAAIDNYVADWYEVSLEAMDLVEGRADFVTDDEINDPEIIAEAKLRVIKSMYEDRPPGLHEHIAQVVMQETAAVPREAPCSVGELSVTAQALETGPEEEEAGGKKTASRKTRTKKNAAGSKKQDL